MIATGSRNIIASFTSNAEWEPLSMADEGNKFWMHGETGKIHQWDSQGPHHGQKATELGLQSQQRHRDIADEAVNNGHIRGGEEAFDSGGKENYSPYLQGNRDAMLKHQPALQRHIAKHLVAGRQVDVHVPDAQDPYKTISTPGQHSEFWKELE